MLFANRFLILSLRETEMSLELLTNMYITGSCNGFLLKPPTEHCDQPSTVKQPQLSSIATNSCLLFSCILLCVYILLPKAKWLPTVYCHIIILFILLAMFSCNICYVTSSVLVCVCLIFLFFPHLFTLPFLKCSSIGLNVLQSTTNYQREYRELTKIDSIQYNGTQCAF